MPLYPEPSRRLPRYTEIYALSVVRVTARFLVPSCLSPIVISVNDISMRFGARVLFEDATTTFLPGRRYAITGPNGSGKSTFMKILTGEIEPTKGSVTRPKKVGKLRQDQFAFDPYRVLDTVIMGNGPLWEALEERENLYAHPDDWTDEDGMRVGELEGIVGEQGGYTAEADAAVLLQGLDIGAALLWAPGQKPGWSHRSDRQS